MLALGCSGLSPAYASGMRVILSEPYLPGVVIDHVVSTQKKVVHGARMGRWGLLEAGTTLAIYVARWTIRCSKGLRGLMLYVNSIIEWTLSRHVGGPAEKLSLPVILGR